MSEIPTDRKAVHFQDNSLEHIRLFLRKESSSAAIADSLPMAFNHDSLHFPFNNEGLNIQSHFFN